MLTPVANSYRSESCTMTLMSGVQDQEASIRIASWRTPNFLRASLTVLGVVDTLCVQAVFLRGDL